MKSSVYKLCNPLVEEEKKVRPLISYLITTAAATIISTVLSC
jgi:hypothetical protein